MSNHVAFLMVIAVMGLLSPIPLASSMVGPNPELAPSQSPDDPIRIRGDADFTEENGVMGGSGTPLDPFVIEGWTINASTQNGIDILGTNAHFVIRNVVVRASPPGSVGIQLENVTNGTVESVELMGTAVGIVLSECANVSLLNNRFAANSEWSILSDGSSGISIEGNRISESSGVFLFNSTALHVADNLINSTEMNAIEIIRADNLTLESNSVWENELGFWLVEVSNATVKTNYVWDNRLGLILQESHDVTLEGNAFVGSGISLEGFEPEHFQANSISETNSVNGRPVYFYRDCSDEVLRGRPAGQVFIVGCRGVEVHDVQLEDVDVGIQIAFAENVTLSGVNVSTAWWGIRADHSNNLSIQNSALWNNDVGLFLRETNNVTLSDSRVSMNSVGAGVFRASNLTITRNTFSHNSEVGLALRGATNIRVFHNDFVDNAVHGQSQESNETLWDGGYPEGGNYWSDHEGVDQCSGPEQDTCPDPDGFGDSEYIIDLFYPYDDVRDRYPLVEPIDSRNARPEVAAPLPIYPILAAVAVLAGLVATILLLWRRKARDDAT